MPPDSKDVARPEAHRPVLALGDPPDCGDLMHTASLDSGEEERCQTTDRARMRDGRGGGSPPSRLRTSLSDRDLAVLRAVAAGRCQMSTACGGSLTVDGL